MSAHAEQTPWGQWVGHCTRCRESIAGNESRIKLWADVHDSLAHRGTEESE